MTPPPPGCTACPSLLRGGGGQGRVEAGGEAPRSSLCAWSTSWSTAASLQSPGTPPGSAGLPQVIPSVPRPPSSLSVGLSMGLAQS